MFEDLREYVEDMVVQGLYDEFSETIVDRFLRNFDEDVLTIEINELLEKIMECIDSRTEEIAEEIEHSDEEEE